ncbi:tetratricopeptide repeat protein [Acinetobacter sp. c3-l95]|uniref:tetratricopeptide repeat protein n=1 Tax=Acinetobacter sp. c3-l95 TaxID=3342804 RepID=UPI0035B88536
MKKRFIAVLSLALIFGSVNTQAKDNVIPDFKITLQQAQKGNTEAQFNVGVMYGTGTGVKQDDAQAVYWYTKAMQQGNILALNNLGLLYATGSGVPKDYQKAKQLLENAANHGYLEAIAKEK